MTRASAHPHLLNLTLPVAAGYMPLGMAFGFLFVKTGVAGGWALLCSLLIYAGAAQFMLVPMLAAQAPLSSIALATLVINLRHMFYGLSLLDGLPKQRLKRGYCIFALTDETYSVLTALPKPQREKHAFTLAALNQCWWLVGTALGILLGTNIQTNFDGIDFVLAALFTVLAVEQWRSRQSLHPAWAALGSYALALLLWPSQALVLSIIFSLLIILFKARHASATRVMP